MMKPARNAILVLLLLCTFEIKAVTPLQECSTLQGHGGAMTGPGLRLVFSAGQPGMVSTTQGQGITCLGGFFNCFTFTAGDTDGDGVVDEIDPDNDGDGLGDGEEVTGSAFSPSTPTDLNRADSDGDGVTDGAESAAGSNPDNPTEYLHFTEVAGETAGPSLSWQARAGKRYRVYQKTPWDGVTDGTLVATVSAAGGSPPWFTTTGHVFDVEAGDASHRIYYIEVEP